MSLYVIFTTIKASGFLNFFTFGIFREEQEIKEGEVVTFDV